MCDKCGTIFSENDEGWSSTTGAIQRRKDDGRRYSEQVNIDLCLVCTGNTGQITPRLPTQAALAAGPDSVPASATTSDQAERDYDHYRIAELEQQLNELRYPNVTMGPVPGTATQPPPVIIPSRTVPDGQDQP